MISNILPSSSGFSWIIKTSCIHLTGQGITWLLLTFLRYLSYIYTKNPFSVNEDKPNIISLFPISNTSLSILNLLETEEESISWNVVLITKFPPKQLPSPCLNLTFFAVFYIPNLHARRFPTTKALGPVSTTAPTSSPAKYNFTFQRGVCWVVCPMPGDTLLIRFLNAPLSRASWFCSVSSRTSTSFELVPSLHFQ